MLLADKLLTDEVIFKEDLEQIFGKRIWDIQKEEEAKNESPETENESKEATKPIKKNTSSSADDESNEENTLNNSSPETENPSAE